MKRDAEGKSRGGLPSSGSGGGWRNGNQGIYYAGQEVDVLDTVNKWSEAVVVAVDQVERRYHVTYTFWSDRWDEWIAFNSERVRPRGSQTFGGSNPMAGQRVEALDEQRVWLEAEIEQVDDDGRCFVHYKNYHRKFDEWISLESGRLRPFGRTKKVSKRSLAAKMADLNVPSTNETTERRVMVALGERSCVQERYARSLEKRGLRLVRVAGDGNCLFRSVSHQMYGDDSHHELVRNRGLDYMQLERAFFEPYVAQDFETYIREKREVGSWGDEPELQALCELYDRPAQVWSFDADAGCAKVLRAFHDDDNSDNSAGPPMRLSYFGGGHYDSIVPLSRPHRPLASCPPGDAEDAKLASHTSADLSAALAASRRLFDARDLDLETALRASLGIHNDQTDCLTPALADETLDELQAKLDARALKADEDTQLDAAIRLSSQEHDDSRLAKVIGETLRTAATDDDAMLAAALDLSQRDADPNFDLDLSKAIAASLDQQ